MDKAKKVVEFYMLCNKLKNIVRTGWLDWGVTRERVESIAEHVYGTQMLAVSMWSEFGYNIDIKKVLTMLAVHELEETVIGDLTQFQIDKKTKEEMGHKAIKEILSGLNNGETIEQLILEFDERKTHEAQFAYYCDKLECDLQCKAYDEEHCVDLNKQENNKTAQNADVKALLESGKTWGQMWMTFGQARYNYDENFLEVSNYALNNPVRLKTEKPAGLSFAEQVEISKRLGFWHINPQELKAVDLTDRGLNSAYVYEPIKGGAQVIVGADGKYLTFVSAISLEQVINQIKNNNLWLKATETTKNQ